MGAVLCAVIISFVFFWGVTSRHWEGPVVTAVAEVVPIPIARFAGQPILLRNYLRDVHSIEIFLASDDAKAEGIERGITDVDRKQVIERLLKERALEELAVIRNVTLTDEQVNQALAREFNPQGAKEQDFAAFIEETYGWSLEDFTSHIVRPALLTRYLAASFASDHGGDTDALDTYIEQRLQKPDVIRYMKF